ncbi:MAG: hypothetical protein KDC92_13800 [Bacteroidetes bacterium]|nr:hypothetical protein [Bacteroidota bacterium]
MNKLFKPFEYIAGTRALLIGLAIAALSAIIGHLTNIRFDGVLDLHFGNPKPISVHLLDQVLVLGLLTGAFVLAKVILKSNARLLDIVGTISMARLPMLAAGVVMLLLPNEELRALMDKDQFDLQSNMAFIEEHLAVFIIVGLALLLLMVYYFQLLWQAYKTCLNRTDGKAVALFIGLLLAAEILSKIILMLLAS